MLGSEGFKSLAVCGFWLKSIYVLKFFHNSSIEMRGVAWRSTGSKRK